MVYDTVYFPRVELHSTLKQRTHFPYWDDPFTCKLSERELHEE